jgi:LmbE family N-acetylglucosaminyl deacetylase
VPINADSRLDTIPKREIVGYTENVLNKIKPEVIIVQGPSFHHDHTIVYESTIAATRPTARHCPNEIYIMENPTYIHSLGPATDFRPDFYITLSEDQMQKKLDLFSQHFPSQIREESNYLSPEGILSWSRYRGIECRHQYAEAFKTFRRIA